MKTSGARIITRRRHMLNHQTIDKLHTMKMIGMADAFTDQLN
jgi:hypothetical protein